MLLLTGKGVKAPFLVSRPRHVLLKDLGAIALVRDPLGRQSHLAPGPVEGQELNLAGLSSSLYFISLRGQYVSFTSIDRKEKRRR